MVIGLAVAAVALIAAVIYFVIVDRGPHEDAADDVNVGSEQRDYGDEPTAAPAPSPSFAPVPPKPVSKPPPAQPKKGGDDIYDGL
jgi:hypothetical protein